MTSEKFCKIIEGIGTTTDVDSHGDKLTLEALEKIRDSINSGKMNDLLHNHDENNKIGELISSSIIEEGGIFKLKVKAGVYNGKEEYADMINEQILRGFSVGIIVGGTKEEFDNCKVKLEVSPWIRREIEKTLNRNKIKHIDYIRKSADVTQIIGITIEGVGALAGIIGLLYTIYSQKKQSNPATVPVNIIINGNNNTINGTNLEEIISKIRNVR